MTLWFKGQRGPQLGTDPTFFTSKPGVGAGNAVTGLYACVAFMIGESDAPAFQEAGLLSNRDNARTRGWLIRCRVGNGTLELFAEIGRSDGTLLIISRVVALNRYQGYYVSLYVGPGVDADVFLDANGVNLIATTLGAGLSFVPEVGQPFDLGAYTGTGFTANSLRSNIHWLGAAFISDSSMGFPSLRQGAYNAVVVTERFVDIIETFGEAVAISGGSFKYQNGWSTQGLLGDGLHTIFLGNPPKPDRPALGQIGLNWVPDIGDQTLVRQDAGFYNYPIPFINRPANWASIAAPLV